MWNETICCWGAAHIWSKVRVRLRLGCFRGCWCGLVWSALIFFFFQAEDGIRDVAVTGVQTCALPIFLIFLPLPVLRMSSGSTGLPFGASTLVTRDEARMAISYMRSENMPFTATTASSPSSSTLTTDASMPPEPEADSGMVMRFSV